MNEVNKEMVNDKMVNNKWLRHVGYGFGDMSSSMFWKVFSYYLPFFYSNIFGYFFYFLFVYFCINSII